MFFFVVGVALPIIGVLFSLWIVLLLKYKPVKKESVDVKMIDMGVLYLSFPVTKRRFGEGAMMLMMKNRHAPVNMKLRALAAMENDINRHRLAIIRHALSDRNDEVRLFGFSIIDKMEKRINEEINRYRNLYEEAENLNRKIDVAKQLAMLYWDLVYFELVDDVLREFLMKESEEMISFVLKYRFEDIPMHILRGKINLYRKNYFSAQAEFSMALELDPDRYGFVAPYLAEIFYTKGNYRTTKALLSQYENLHYSIPLSSVVDLWMER